MISQHEIDEISTRIVTKMREDRHVMWIDPETHALEHAFIREFMLERKERQDRRKRVQEKIAGSVILSAIVFIIGLLGSGTITWIRELLK